MDNIILTSANTPNASPERTFPRYPANLAAINRRFERFHPRNVLCWGLTTLGKDIVLATSFGPTSIILMHLASQLKIRIPVFYLQTDLLFPETIALRDQLAQRLGIEFIEVHSGLSLDEQARQYGPELWQRDPDLCCHLRKVEPLRRFLAGKRAWITGLRRDQSPDRAQTPVVAWDQANQLIKLNPLATWPRDRIWQYIQEYNLPYNALHNAGYPSIGCMPCTQAVADSDDERAGRWAGLTKTECGIHIQPNGRLIRR
jgi:phosphoadenosine phosphosulfate reductase